MVLSEEEQILNAQFDMTRYRVTIGSEVTWYSKSERWRIEIVGSSSLQAVFVTHSALVRLTAVNSFDPGVVAGLIQIHREAIEQSIGVAEVEVWPDRLGILPHRFEVAYQVPT